MIFLPIQFIEIENEMGFFKPLKNVKRMEYCGDIQKINCCLLYNDCQAQVHQGLPLLNNTQCKAKNYLQMRRDELAEMSRDGMQGISISSSPSQIYTTSPLSFNSLHNVIFLPLFSFFLSFLLLFPFFLFLIIFFFYNDNFLYFPFFLRYLLFLLVSLHPLF